MQIKFDNYEICYPKRLKKIFQSNLNMKTYRKFVPYVERAVVGNIPPELIRIFPKNTRGEDIKKFQTILADMTNYLRTSWQKKGIAYNLTNPITYGKSDTIICWECEANEIFDKHLKTFANTQLSGKLEYIDYGISAKVFRVSVFNKDGQKIMHDKALKVFNSPSGNPAELKLTCHGNYAETNFWTYLKRAAGHALDRTQFTKHYISDLNNGYALTEFADEKITKTTAPIDFRKLLKLRNSDAGHNSPIYGKIYDAGGFVKLSDFTDDKVVLRYFKKLYFRSKKELPEVLKNLETQAQNPKNEHHTKIQKAINLFTQC